MAGAPSDGMIMRRGNLAMVTCNVLAVVHEGSAALAPVHGERRAAVRDGFPKRVKPVLGCVLMPDAARMANRAVSRSCHGFVELRLLRCPAQSLHHAFPLHGAGQHMVLLSVHNYRDTGLIAPLAGDDLERILGLPAYDVASLLLCFPSSFH